MLIRLESQCDITAISKLTEEAFKTMPYSDGSESRIIANLRKDGDLALSLVADDDGEVVGHVAFSPILINHVCHRWYGLGPLSVHPSKQKTGIGSRLIKEGIRLINEMGGNGIALVGDPKFYGRFGFVADGKLSYKDLPTDLVQWYVINGGVPSGKLSYSRAFTQ